MRAIVVKPGVRDSIHMRDMPDPRLKPDQVAVKMIRAGLCRTDAEISHGLFGQAPDRRRIPDSRAREFRGRRGSRQKGQRVQGRRPRRVAPCGGRAAATPAGPARTTCATKAGIRSAASLGRHGFMAEYYVESPQWLNKIPEERRGDRRAARADVGRRERDRSRVPASAARCSGGRRPGSVLGAGPDRAAWPPR